MPTDSISAPLDRVISAYESSIVKAYCWGRFQILRQRFLDEVGQYLPQNGKIVDLGCGFGLFSLFYGCTQPGRELHGFDLNPKRIASAQRAASKLGVRNVKFAVGDVTTWSADSEFDAAYLLDIVHHIPPDAVQDLVCRLRRIIKPNGVLIIKDVADTPFFKTTVTWFLDKVMDPKTPVHYWSIPNLSSLIRQSGFDVYSHLMVDYLPYPHVIYICRPK